MAPQEGHLHPQVEFKLKNNGRVSCTVKQGSRVLKSVGSSVELKTKSKQGYEGSVNLNLGRLAKGQYMAFCTHSRMRAGSDKELSNNKLKKSFNVR